MILLIEKSIQAGLNRCLSHATISVAFKNPDNGDEIVINERKKFHAASTMKTPVWEKICFDIVIKECNKQGGNNRSNA